ncbi:hypothetical protein AZE42_04500 [Rhizopogon vesiculosus]|uniref:Uncharacterized protein n=1 Tax=Rhizopogon vesiculosus TaxID=180088 RepID=A0A1J8R0U5_9AGAM|nr:hypothetical protein AZE42_04500 [Rhizopogon vesiculosus]
MSKSRILPSNFIGTTMAGVQVEDGQFRIYYQGKDYKLYEMQLDNPDDTQYSLFNLSDFTPDARINTPIAAFAWNGLQDIRVYYITATSKVQEIIHTAQGGWFPGDTLGTAVENSSCLYAQVRASLPQASLRVGFQSTKSPQTITEAYLVDPNEGWKTRVF